MMFKILVADDEDTILEPICDYMTAKGFKVSSAHTGKEAVKLSENGNYDLIILDVMMPETDGLEACRQIKAFTDTPVLFLSALGEECDFLKGYKNGCDDYIVKPFPLSVLHQKCLSIIKRCKNLNDDNKIIIGNVMLDMNSQRVFASGSEVKLSSRDYQIICCLMQNRNIVLSRELILTRIWGYDFEGDTRVVDTHIKRIRASLGQEAKIIKTIFGVGYMIEERSNEQD